MTRVAALSLLATLVACGHSSSPAPDAGTKPAGGGKTDSGPRDAGHASPDSGPRKDAGTDAGPVMTSTDAGDAGGMDSGPVDAGHDAGPRTHGLLARVENTTCFVNGAPPIDVVPVAHTPAFKALTATSAAALIAAPGNKLAVVTKAGLIRAFAADGDGSDASGVLDLSSVVRTDGLLGAAFRPDGGALVASYLPSDNPLRIVVARFALDSQGKASLASKEELLPAVPLTDAAHAGGALAFLFDGTLVVALGDGGTSAAATDATVLAGKLLRIDVSGSSGYTVPADNPFVASSTTPHEVYALGLAAPTSCSVDRVSGHLWCADAGAASDDHLLLVTPGATLSPILSFTRVGCGAVLGFVSRDAKLPDIQGDLVFGDACSKTVQAMRFDGSLVRSQKNIATLPANLSAFGQDADGRMLALDAAGALHALVRPATPAPAFPTTVSATGCIADMANRTPAASLVPFEVRTPLWSDGARKHRFIILPGSATIGFTTEGAWELPAGTMFMKEFLLDDDNDESTDNPIMETRFLIKRTDTSWEGYSYMWDPARKDAFLLDGAEIGKYPMQSGKVDSSGASIHRHTFPDRNQCLLCHNAAAGRALGLQTGRMNTDHDYDGFVENQLAAMDHIGLFTDPLPKKPDALPRFPEPSDTTALLEDRARSWLYANCSHCHRLGGPTPVALDFRFETPFASTNTCGVTPRFNISQIPNAKIIDPGHSDTSEMFFRLSRRDQNQMPPIATLIIEPTGVDAVKKWIDSLTTCP